MKAIVAMAPYRIIGKNGTMPWPSLKDDLKFFKETTWGKHIIVGRKTFDNLPKLKNRTVFVLSNSMCGKIWENQYGLWGFGGDLETIQTMLLDKEGVFVCGGSETYKLLLPQCSELFVSHIKLPYDGDTYMPTFEHLFNKQETIKETEEFNIIKYYK